MKSKKKNPTLLKKAVGNNLLWAFLVPFVGILAYMLVSSVEPFSNNYAILYSDQYHQYYPFFVAYRKALLSGESLLYSWDVGMGMDYVGLVSYYVASPLYLLSVLVPESWTLEFFALLLPLRLGLASLFFAIFLKKTFGKDDFSIAVFGAFYGLCAWALAYQWNVMWLDTFALLPLVVLGTIELLRDKKFVLYTVTLFLSVFCNYYIGFFTCIFVLILFICYQICTCKSAGRFFADLGRIALFTVLAIGMTAVLALPTLAGLQNTQSSVNEFPTTFGLNIVDSSGFTYTRDAWRAYNVALEEGADFWTLAGMYLVAVVYSIPPILTGMAQVAGNMSGAMIPSFKEGLPNLYCGVATIALGFLYLSSKKVKLREKVCAVVVLCFLMLSFLLRQLDYIWHGFHFTNQIPYRFSFLYSFIMLYMAYRAWTLRDEFKLWQWIVVSLLTSCIFLLSERWDKPVTLLYNFGFLALFVGVFIAGRIDAIRTEKRTEKPVELVQETELPTEEWTLAQAPTVEEEPKKAVKLLTKEEAQKRSVQRQRWVAMCATVVLALELVLNIVNFGIRFNRTTVKDYPRGLGSAASMFKYIREDDSDFFRTEVTHTQTLNDGALNGYNGITTFTSSANVRVTEFMKNLGYGAKNTYNRYAFEQSSPISNLFLNLKYMVEREGEAQENDYFDVLHYYGGMTLMENNTYLPLGFLAEPELGTLDFSQNTDDFSFQNDLFTAATGIERDVWSVLGRKCLEITNNNVEIKSQTSGGYVSYKTDRSGTLRYTYTVDQTGLLCLDLSMSERNSYRVYKNGKELYSETMSLPQMISVCDVVPGDKIAVSITCKKNEEGTVNIRAATVNENIFRGGHYWLSQSTLDLTEFSNTFIEGTIDCNRDGLLYTSVPQNGTNWSVKVDGEPAEIVLVGDAMIAVELTEGKHTVTLTYQNKAFTLGLIISLVCLAAFIAIIVLSHSSLRKGKYEKKATKALPEEEPQSQFPTEVESEETEPEKAESEETESEETELEDTEA